MSFQGQLVRLRARTRSDLPLFTKWFNDPDVTIFLANAYPALSIEKEERLFEGWIDDPNVFSIETLDERLIGNCSLFRVDTRSRSAELGIAVGDKEFWGQGYGGEAIELLLAYAFEHLGLHRVYLRFIDFNARGRRCYERCGFREEGRLREAVFVRGRWHDEVVMGILEQEWRARRDQ
jgi:RimJ/RimL family protein N-acetyltransferase